MAPMPQANPYRAYGIGGVTGCVTQSRIHLTYGTREAAVSANKAAQLFGMAMVLLGLFLVIATGWLWPMTLQLWGIAVIVVNPRDKGGSDNG